MWDVAAASMVALMVAGATLAGAVDLNPLHWIGAGVGGVVNAALSAAFVALVAWLGKGKWDAVQLKKAVAGIKAEVDQFRVATGQASPGGTKIVAEEWGGLAGATITNVLTVLRGLNPSWMPHIGEGGK